MPNDQRSAPSYSAGVRDAGPLPRRGGLLTIVSLGVIGLGIGAWVLFGGGAEGEAPSTSTGTGSMVVGSAAPSFTVRLLDGGTFNLDQHLDADGRPVIVNFWASWCEPCTAEMPALDAAATDNPDVLFIGVATDDTEAAARRFGTEIGVGYPLGIDTTGVVAADYGAFGLPTTVGVAADGTVAAITFGEMDAAEIDELVADVRG